MLIPFHQNPPINSALSLCIALPAFHSNPSTAPSHPGAEKVGLCFRTLGTFRVIMIIIVIITSIINIVIEAKASHGSTDVEKLLMDRSNIKEDADRTNDDAGATSDAGDSDTGEDHEQAWRNCFRD